MAANEVQLLAHKLNHLLDVQEHMKSSGTYANEQRQRVHEIIISLLHRLADITPIQ